MMKGTAMTRHILPLILLASACLAQTVPLRWSVELGDARPARFTLVRGDTVELAADLFAEGRPYNPATADASLLWQTNGMDELWWEVPAAVASNRVSATWGPAMDCGAASYLAHFRVGSSTGSVFRAYARLAMQHGPGDPPNALPLPVPFIDFAKVAVTNEPWSTTSGLSTNNVLDLIAAATNAIPAGITEEQVREIVQNDSPVTSVNGGTGDIIIDAAAIGAVEDTDPRVHNYLHIDGNDGNPYLALYDDEEQLPAVTLFKSSILWRDSSTLFELYFPTKNGTLALFEDIPSIDGLATVEDVASVTQRVDVASSSVVRYATGVLNLTIPQSATLSANTSAWPDGAAVFARVSANGVYSVAQGLSLVGYGFWPTNSATVVFVRDGQTVRANVVQGN